MPSRVQRQARSFLAWYARTMPIRNAAADEIHRWMEERIEDLGVAVDSVTARAKDLRSAKGKLRRKRYKAPKRELTDTIGVRVVLLFEEEVETVTQYLRSAIDVNERHSRVAGQELGLAEFGYRSVQLIGRFRGRTMPRYSELGRPWVELQVQSALQHAWAATGHDYFYKGALPFPDSTKRRFFAIAGGLELFDREFNAIRARRDELHQQWLTAFRSGRRLGDNLDIAGVSALLAYLFPGSSWSTRGRGLPPVLEIALMECLAKAGIKTARNLGGITRRPRFLRKLVTYAAGVGTAPNSVSNFAKAVLAISDAQPELISIDYDELIEDQQLRDAASL